MVDDAGRNVAHERVTQSGEERGRCEAVEK